MKRYIAWMTIALFSGAVLTACAGRPGGEQTPPSEIHSLIARELQLKEPRDAGSLLHNMRAVLERGSMTQRHFFSDDQLKATFGGSTIEWEFNTPSRVNARLGPLEFLPVRWRKMRIPNISFLWWAASQSVPDKPAGNFSIGCDCELTATDIEAVFGDVDRTVDRDRRGDRSHHPVPKPTANPLGNKIVRYTLRGPEGYISSFEVSYDPEGRVIAMAGRTDPVDSSLSVPNSK